MFFRGGRKLFEKKLFFPHTPNFQKTLNVLFLFNIVRSTVKSGVFALHLRSKVLVKLFQKLAGLGSAHKNGVFFLPSFFFAPLVPKKKRDNGILCFFRGERKLLERSFSSPHTPNFQKTSNVFVFI